MHIEHAGTNAALNSGLFFRIFMNTLIVVLSCFAIAWSLTFLGFSTLPANALWNDYAFFSVFAFFSSLFGAKLFMKFTWMYTIMYGNIVTITIWHIVWFLILLPIIAMISAIWLLAILCAAVVVIAALTNLGNLLDKFFKGQLFK